MTQEQANDVGDGDKPDDQENIPRQRVGAVGLQTEFRPDRQNSRSLKNQASFTQYSKNGDATHIPLNVLLAALPPVLELSVMAHEIPSRNCSRHRRYKHRQVADTQMHAGLRQCDDLARDGTVAMTRDVQIDHGDYERSHNCGSNSRGRTDR
jgi:hypothetical protein